MNQHTATAACRSEEATSLPFAIPFVLTPEGILCDASMVRRSWVRDFLSRSYFQCACCRERVVARCGFKRPLYFAHFPATADSTPCAWRVVSRGGCVFDERNPDGDDGAWHVKAQLQIMSILERTGVDCVRNAYVKASNEVRKPDISCKLMGQVLHFEVQSSPTSAPSAAQRTERDFRSLTSTIWIVNADRYGRHIKEGLLPCWMDNIASFGGGQLWLWDDECYHHSLTEGQLYIKRALIGSPEQVSLDVFSEAMPYTFPIEARLRTNGHFSIAFPPGSGFASKPAVHAVFANLLAEMRHQLTRRLGQFGHTYRIEYPTVRLNTPILDYIFSDGQRHRDMRDVFNNRWLKVDD